MVTAVDEPIPTDLTVFPNPANASLSVLFTPLSAPDADVTITDLAGRIRFRQPANATGKQIINIASLPTGIYILRLSDGRTRRFFVE